MSVREEIHGKYAVALLEASEEAKVVESVIKDMQLIEELFRREEKFERLLCSRVFHDKDKLKLLERLLFPYIGKLMINFIRVMCRNGRISELKKVCEEFFLQIEKREGVTRAKLVTAYPFSHDTVEWLRQRLETYFSKKFKIDCHVKPELLAGFNFKFEDKMLDCSAAKYFQEFKEMSTLS